MAEEVLVALRAEGAVSEPQLFTATAVVFDPSSRRHVTVCGSMIGFLGCAQHMFVMSLCLYVFMS